MPRTTSLTPNVLAHLSSPLAVQAHRAAGHRRARRARHRDALLLLEASRGAPARPTRAVPAAAALPTRDRACTRLPSGLQGRATAASGPARSLGACPRRRLGRRWRSASSFPSRCCTLWRSSRPRCSARCCSCTCSSIVPQHVGSALPVRVPRLAILASWGGLTRHLAALCAWDEPLSHSPDRKL